MIHICRFGSGFFDPRIGRSAFDPFFQIGDRGGRKFSFGGHLDRIIGVTDRFDEQALVRFARHECGTRFASFADSVATVEQQFAAEFFRVGRMAFQAMSHQQRPDFLLEEFIVGIVRTRSVRRADRREGQCRQNEDFLLQGDHSMFPAWRVKRQEVGWADDCIKLGTGKKPRIAAQTEVTSRERGCSMIWPLWSCPFIADGRHGAGASKQSGSSFISVTSTPGR